MRDLALIAVFFGLLLPSLVLPQVGVLIWGWISIMNPHREVYGLANQVPFNLVIAVMTLGMWFVSQQAVSVPKRSFTFCVLGMIVVITISLAASMDPSYSFPIWDRHVKTFVLVLVVLGLMNTKVRIYAMVWVLAIAIGYFGVKGGGFAIATGGNYRILGPEKSMISDNNHLALAMVFSLPLWNWLRLQAANPLVRLGCLGVLVLTIISILGTYSRGGFIGLAAVLLVIWLKSRRKLFGAIILLAVAAPALTLMPAKYYERLHTIQTAGEDGSFQARLDAWSTGFNIASSRPLTGAGLRAYENYWIYRQFNPNTIASYGRAMHSIYFELLADTGVPGLAVFLIAVFVSWRNARFIAKHTRDRADLKWARDFASASEASCAAFLVAGAGLSMAFYDFFWVVLALILQVRICVERAIDPAHQPAALAAVPSPVGGAASPAMR